MYTSRWKEESEAPNEEVTWEPPMPTPVLEAVVWSLIWLGNTLLPLNPALFSICLEPGLWERWQALPQNKTSKVRMSQIFQTLHRVERKAWMASPGTIFTQGNPEKSDQTHILPGGLMFAEESDMGTKSEPASVIVTYMFNDCWGTQASKG